MGIQADVQFQSAWRKAGQGIGERTTIPADPAHRSGRSKRESGSGDVERIIYLLETPDGKHDFNVMIPSLTNSKRRTRPQWARLTCHQCANCPLSREDYDFCPPAHDMIDVVEQFSKSNSHDPVNLYVWTKNETHSLRTNLQRALAYVYPVIVANSACPYASLLAPAVKFGRKLHDFEDTIFYAVSMSLAKFYLHRDEDRQALDWVRTLAIVFTGLLQRAREASGADANASAFAKILQWADGVQNPEMFIKCLMEEYFGAVGKK